jgi:putative membrane protein
MTTIYRIKRFYKIGILPATLMILYSGSIYYFYEFRGINALDISLGISTILGISISLLLGFRTNAAYDRWWEGRKIWGAIINDTRSLTRQLLGYVKQADNHDSVYEISQNTISWCYALKHTLRKTSMDEDLSKYVDEKRLLQLKSHRNVPNMILKDMEVQIRSLKESNEINEYEFVTFFKASDLHLHIL